MSSIEVRADFCFWEEWRVIGLCVGQGGLKKYAGQVMRNFERWVFRLSAILIFVKSGRRDVVGCLRVMEARGIVDTLRKRKTVWRWCCVCGRFGNDGNQPCRANQFSVFERKAETALSPSGAAPGNFGAAQWICGYAGSACSICNAAVSIGCCWQWRGFRRRWWVVRLDGRFGVSMNGKRSGGGMMYRCRQAMQWVLDQARALNVYLRFVCLLLWIFGAYQ